MTWLTWSRGFEFGDVQRRTQLDLAYFRQVDDLAYDEELRERYRRSGIDALLVMYAITEPTAARRRPYRRRAAPSQWGVTGENGMMVEISIPDRPELGPEELDAYLAAEIRGVLESWSKLAAA